MTFQEMIDSTLRHEYPRWMLYATIGKTFYLLDILEEDRYSYMTFTQRGTHNIDNKVKETIRKYTNHMDL